MDYNYIKDGHKMTDLTAKCPLCKTSLDKQFYSLSRVDNKTHICSDCGTWEALAPMRNTWGLMAQVLEEVQNGN